MLAALEVALIVASEKVQDSSMATSVVKTRATFAASKFAATSVVDAMATFTASVIAAATEAQAVARFVQLAMALAFEAQLRVRKVINQRVSNQLQSLAANLKSQVLLLEVVGSQSEEASCWVY